MSAMYTDAKDWLEQNVTEGGIDAATLLSFVLNEVSNDDIERWFGVCMESSDDNPGYIDPDDEPEEEEDIEEEGEEENEYPYLLFVHNAFDKHNLRTNYYAIWLNRADFDYDWRNDTNVYTDEK